MAGVQDRGLRAETPPPGSRLRAVRRALGWSSAHLGVRSGVGVRRLAEVEELGRAPTGDELAALAAVLGVPAAELREPGPASAGGRGRGGPAGAGGRPVLVVDDDPDVREAVRGALGGRGLAVVEAGDGREALAAAAAAPPCLILLDMGMPVLDGWGFAAVYRAHPGRRAPVVVMTAARDARAWAAEIGADGVLPKPFDLDALGAALAHARP
jgi:CheY-like chemotaxis protein